MKRPNETVKKEKLAAGSRGAIIKRKPTGGKALARLKQFVLKRNLPFNMANKTVPNAPAPRMMARGASARTMNVVTSGSAEAVVQNYTQALAAASMAASPATPAVLMAAPRGARMRRMASPAVPQWRFIGPSSITHGQTYGNSRVIVSGRVAAIAIDPKNSKHILVGSAGGGVWESRDRGASWNPRTDFMPSLKSGAIVFDPKDSSKVYCGTGEGNDYAGLGQGLMKSTDGGTTWEMLCTVPFAGLDFFDLIVDPLNGKHLLAATNEGMYTSIDGGVNWTQRQTELCWDLAMTSTGGPGDEVLAACEDGLFQSKDGGDSFVKVNLPAGQGGYDRLAVAISTSNPEKAYAFGVRAGADIALLWCRTTADGAWKAITPPADINVGQAWYDWFLEVSPDNADQIYLGAIEAYRGTKSSTKWNWVTMTKKRGDDIHPDQHCLTIDPANADNIFIGNDGGIFFSPNRGKNWQSLNPGLGITEIEYMAQNLKERNWLFAGTQDNGSIRYTGSLQWEQVADGDGGDCGVNLAAPEVCYHTFYGMGMERSTKRGQKNSWTLIGPHVNYNDGDIFYPPMEVNGDIVAQAGYRVFISRNRGTAWHNIALPRGDEGTAMYIPTTDVLYVGTTKGAIYKITWNGTKWSDLKSLAMPRQDAYISDLYADPNNLNRLWVTSTMIGGNRCFRSDDGGASWVNCTPGLPDLPISSIEVDPADPNRIWVAADMGVYQSLDAGSTWAVLSKGLPNALACDLLYNPIAKLLRVGLRNRGVWELEL